MSPKPLRAARTFLAAVLVFAAVATSASAARPPTGKYKGTTSQGNAIKLTVRDKGKRVDFAFPYDMETDCTGNSTFVAGNTDLGKGVKIKTNGTFSFTFAAQQPITINGQAGASDRYTYTVTGKFKKNKVKGTFSERVDDRAAGVFHEEAPHSPGLVGHRIDDAQSAFDRRGVRRVDRVVVAQVHAEPRRGNVESGRRDEDLSIAVGRRDEPEYRGFHRDFEAEHVRIEGSRRIEIRSVCVRDHPRGARALESVSHRSFLCRESGMPESTASERAARAPRPRSPR
jgi:hypothetical protein